MTFLVRPSFLPGESMSSWRLRSGRANGFLHYPLAPNERCNSDPDFSPHADVLEWISSNCSVHVETLQNHCLDQFRETLFSGVGNQSYVQWLMPSKLQQRSIRSLGCYCPACLAEDEVPYFRLKWRLAFVTHCEIHQCLLQEGCPECGAPVWPNVLRDRRQCKDKPIDLPCCLHCGGDVRQSCPSFDDYWRLSDTLWNSAVNRVRTGSIPDNATLPDYFYALWLTCRLVRRQFLALSSVVPNEVMDGSELIPGFGIKLEYTSVKQRAFTIRLASWLMEDWPNRFVAIGKSAKLSGTEFSRGEFDYPEWFDQEIKKHFLRRTNWIGHGEVSAAAEAMKGSGRKVSKNALRRALGVRENWAINELLDQRRSATLDELARVCEHYHYLIEHTPPSRDQQRTLCRDFLILLCSSLSGQSVEKVCRFTREEVEKLHFQGVSFAHSDDRLGIISATLKELFDQYRQGIRPVFLARAPEPTQYCFLSRFGKPMDGHSVRARFARIMKDIFEPKLWNSIDVFLRTLHISSRPPDELPP